MALEGKHVHRKTCIHMADTSLWPLWCIRHRSAQLRSLSGEVKGWSDTQTLPLLHKPTHIEAFPGEAGGLPGHVMCCRGLARELQSSLPLRAETKPDHFEFWSPFSAAFDEQWRIKRTLKKLFKKWTFLVDNTIIGKEVRKNASQADWGQWGPLGKVKSLWKYTKSRLLSRCPGHGIAWVYIWSESLVGNFLCRLNEWNSFLLFSCSFMYFFLWWMIGYKASATLQKYSCGCFK